MANRFTLRKIIPDIYQIFMQLSQAVSNSGIDRLHQELIKIRASQSNGCAYCFHKHSKDAITYGEDPKRLYVLTAWQRIGLVKRSSYFKANRRNHPHRRPRIKRQTYDYAVRLFGEEMTAKLIVAVININALNRLGVSFTMHR